jgi:hypothetical protein
MRESQAQETDGGSRRSANVNRPIPSAFAGNASEFFVLAELTRRGWTATLTARNNRAYDVLAKREDEFAAIRVNEDVLPHIWKVRSIALLPDTTSPHS